MATYSQLQATRELRDKRKVQDRQMAALHRSFDLSAQDNHMKYERPSFAVVTASDAFRKGYDEINWEKDNRVLDKGAAKGKGAAK